MLSLNVSKDTINDSYNLSGNYTKLEEVLKQLPVTGDESPVNKKIDEVINIVNEYRNVILKQEGLTIEQWNKKPGNLWRPDGMQAAFSDLRSSEQNPGQKLETGLKNLLTRFETTPGYEDLAKSAPVIFDYMNPDIEFHPGPFESIPLSWSLIYLDGLETNLYLIKTSAGQ
jgi:hypothetical protein